MIMVQPTALIDEILRIVRESNDWISRREIALLLGRPRQQLYAHDIALLDDLVNRDVLDVRRPGFGIRAPYEYRVKAVRDVG